MHRYTYVQAWKYLCSIAIASFPGLPTIQFLIACSIQWELGQYCSPADLFLFSLQIVLLFLRLYKEYMISSTADCLFILILCIDMQVYWRAEDNVDMYVHVE